MSDDRITKVHGDAVKVPESACAESVGPAIEESLASRMLYVGIRASILAGLTVGTLSVLAPGMTDTTVSRQ